MEQLKQNKPILVIGGTGKTGRRIVTRLQDRGYAVRVGSRSAEVPFIWEDRATWNAALEGVETAYIAYFPDLAGEGAYDDIRAFADLAEEKGLKRAVLLSGRGEPSTIPCENEIKRFEWTVLRASWFNQNFNENFFAGPLSTGVLPLPIKDIPEPFIDVDDIAEAAVVALTADGFNGQTYELTGPRALNFNEAVAEIAKAVGRDIRFESISVEAYKVMMREQQVPEEVIDVTLYLYQEVLDGRNVHPQQGIQQILGREPKDFATYAKEAAASGCWDAPKVEGEAS